MRWMFRSRTRLNTSCRRRWSVGSSDKALLRRARFSSSYKRLALKVISLSRPAISAALRGLSLRDAGFSWMMSKSDRQERRIAQITSIRRDYFAEFRSMRLILDCDRPSHAFHARRAEDFALAVAPSRALCRNHCPVRLGARVSRQERSLFRRLTSEHIVWPSASSRGANIVDRQSRVSRLTRRRSSKARPSVYSRACAGSRDLFECMPRTRSFI
jgi:hypothetical protein